MSGQQQYFRIQPKDVKVHEGGEAMLECEVTNQAGQVQWTKDGFALGNSSHLLSVQLLYVCTHSVRLATDDSHFRFTSLVDLKGHMSPAST